MGIISKIFHTSDKIKSGYTVPREEWNELITCIDNRLKETRKLFFNKCVETVNNSNYNIKIINKKNEGKADIVIKSYQLINIIQYISRYIRPSEAKEFIDLLFRKICGKQHKKCYDLVSCYLGLGESKIDKRIYYFSIDIGKFICGYTTDDIPSKFPCLNSYISSGIPKEILARTDVTASSLLIQSLIPNLTVSTITALSLCFGEEFAIELKKKDS